MTNADDQLPSQLDVYDVLVDVEENGIVPGQPERKPQSDVPARLSVRELVAKRLRGPK